MSEPGPSLRAHLGVVLRNPKTFGLSRVPQEPVHVKKAALKLIELFGDLETKSPKPQDLDDLQRRVSRAWRTGGLEALSRRDLRMIPWVFFYPEKSPTRWLGVDPEFVTAYDRATLRIVSGKLAAALLREFLKAGKPEHPTYEGIRRLLGRRLANSASPTLARWRERCTRYGFLLPGNEKALVKAWNESGLSVDDFLRESGLSPSLETSELVRRVLKSVLRTNHIDLIKDKGRPEQLRRDLDWLRTRDALRIHDLRLDIAHNLLQPFVDRKPSSDIAEVLRSFFLACFGDPRLDERQNWFRVPEAQRGVLMRLLVELALSDFFKLLDKTALDEHWQYRKAFWTSYLNKDVLDDAWVVLGKEARSMAYRRLGFDKALSTGSVRGLGVQANHSVLLMRIGRITIAEWSHNGKCRFWLNSNREAPSLYRREYDGYDLRKHADYEVVHAGSANGRWQEKVASWIRGHTGIRAYHHEYMP